MAIVLLFENTAPLAFPANPAVVSSVVSSYGTTFAKDLVYNRSLMVVPKAANTAASATSYSFVQNPDNSVSEIARNVYSVDSTGTKGSFAVGVLKTAGGLSTIEDCLQVDHIQTIFNTTSQTDASQTSTISLNYAGLQFSTDSSCVYFGASQVFRIRYGPNESTDGRDILAFEALATDGSYQTKFSLTQS